MPKFISDEEMAKLEQATASAPKKFISDEEMVKLEDPKRSALTPLESAITAGSQAVTLGFSDEILGAVGALGGSLAGKGKYDDLYKEIRDFYRARNDAAKADNPKSYLAGAIGGSLGTLKLPGLSALAPARTASAGANIGKAAIAGGLTGAGLSEATPTESPEKLGEFTGDVAKGAALGGAVQGGLGLLGKAVGSLKPDKLKAFAEEKAVKAAGGMKRDFKRLEALGRLHKTGREILDRKIVTAFSSLEDVAERSSALKESAGKQIGRSLDDVDDLVRSAETLIDEGKLFSFLPNDKNIVKHGIRTSEIPTKEAAKKYIRENFQFSMRNVADRIRKEIIEENSFNPLVKNELRKISQIADDFSEIGTQSLRGGNKIKNVAGKITKFDSETVPNAFKQQVYGIIKDEIDNTVGKIGTLEEGLAKSGLNIEEILKVNLKSINDAELKNSLAKSAYEQAKKAYQVAKEVEGISLDRLAASQSNRGVSLTDTIAAAGGYAGSGAPGLALGLLNKLGRQYGSSVQAVGADKLADVLARSPNALGKFGETIAKAAQEGPNALIAAHVTLMKDPNYQRILEQENRGGLKLPRQNHGLRIPEGR